jgi:teichuronic acid exporter
LQSTSNLSLKNKVLTGLVWRFLERGGTLGMQFIISIVLARLLLPRDFGTIGLLTVFIAVAGVFVQSGFG